jgi:EAL domain-containing protein (putative c-di-GMP-specific phosphodiesterase class I)
VLAEGVESEAQMNFLREQGCDEVQGYFLGRPSPVVGAVDAARILTGRPAQARTVRAA